MSATELWLLAAAITAGVAAILHLAGQPPWVRFAHAAAAAAVGLVAIALMVALP